MDLSKYQSLEGTFISLRAITEDDALDIYNWRTSASGTYLNQPQNYSVESQRGWIRSRGPHEINYIIYSKGTPAEKVGMISIVDIDEQNRKAEVGRLLLGEKYLSISNPFGLEALKMTYAIVLNEWNFNKIHGTILALNEKMVKLQDYLGMEKEGIFKRHLLINNQYTDLYLYSIFQDGLNKKYLPRINFLLRSFNNFYS